MTEPATTRAMSLLQAASCLRYMPNPGASGWEPTYEHSVTGRGTYMPLKPRPVEYRTTFFRPAAGHECAPEAAW